MRTRPTTFAELVTAFPKIFPAGFHFECGPGWLTILGNLCSCIQHEVDWELSRQKLNGSDPDEHLQVVARQVKEKFGGLRFYVSGGTSQTTGMIAMAEAMAYDTCEDCGHPGTQRDGGWIRTLCDQHHEEFHGGRKVEK